MKTRENESQNYNKIYDCVIVGAGAAGLFYAGLGQPEKGEGHKQNLLILEKTSRPGQKLLMSGSGMCNITHGGSIKDFIGKYGSNGKLIRKCLFRHNNIELVKKLHAAGIETIEREDGKIFPASLKSKDVLDVLLKNAKAAGWKLQCSQKVTSINTQNEPGTDECCIIELTVSNPADSKKGSTSNQIIRTKKLVIACGGSSYPATGSDGSFFSVLERDLGLDIIEPRPALAPVFVQDYPFSDLSGISFENVRVTCTSEEILKEKNKTSNKCSTNKNINQNIMQSIKQSTEGPMLLTHKGFSGPAMLHISQYVKPGTKISINYLTGENVEMLRERIKNSRSGNTASTSNYISDITSLPKAFVKHLLENRSIDRSSDRSKSGSARTGLPKKRMADLSNKDIDQLIKLLTESTYSVSGTGGFNEAMVTAGGVALNQICLDNMASNDHTADIRIIGEALDINGDTGGYNLQFAYSSAMAALE